MLLVIDGAGICRAKDHARVVVFAVGRGASVQLVGDDQQRRRSPLAGCCATSSGPPG